MARRRRHTRSAEAGGARVWRAVFFPVEREYGGGESIGREARFDMSDLMLLALVGGGARRRARGLYYPL